MRLLKHKKSSFFRCRIDGGSMISGIVKSGKMRAENIYVTNKSNAAKLERLESRYGINAMPQAELPYEDIDMCILAMKPKGAAGVLEALKDKLVPGQVVVSVLAGISTGFMEDNLKDGQQVVRVMPNTSSMIQESALPFHQGCTQRMKTSRM